MGGGIKQQNIMMQNKVPMSHEINAASLPSVIN